MLQRIKRYFVDLRYGYSLIAPLIAYSNFLLIGYNFTEAHELIPFEIFTILFTAGMVSVLVVIGRTFRHKQLSTDEDLRYERAKQQARTNRILLEALAGRASHEDIDERIRYLRDVEAKN